MENLKVYIITGISGSGKTTVAQAFEDASFYCIDNMPMELVPKVLELPLGESAKVKGAAFVMDMRSKTFTNTFVSGVSALEEMGFSPVIIFLEADTQTLVKRFSQTRRHHPLGDEKNLLDSIKSEKQGMAAIRKLAHQIIDTTNFNVHQLKAEIQRLVSKETGFKSIMKLNIMSFGYKYGIPVDADIVVDLRFLANPYFVPELKIHNGESDAVKKFVLENPETKTFLKKYNNLIDYLIPLYEKENKAYLTLALGCTGGRHRSVAISRAVFERLMKKGLNPSLQHRDIDRDIKET
ncbi:RNase adapter RapZ [Desulfobacter hydrogenophilus]|uniref:RNase adapter RapZ n=1 Tax=Desulfobacter hydrogenophilus TaxID=2291 RepID=A0A328FL67_9BACT|nr:RNase adapter RapZ [Desulfobacter hydrogenophilus]NDY71766.1 RNase adapter RapZ [Desulfobacter hydrogenophilus]QBH13464.1 RNase adapter RapZ [Desulfobacter hydrogenophilus]RAM03715.1 RNase adapter RapZ [Desulfobacter hydrogenophilus]